MVMLSELIATHNNIIRQEGKKPETKRWYQEKLGDFERWALAQPGFSGDAEDITVSMVREYFLHLMEEPRTAVNTRNGVLTITTVQNHYRALRAFVNRMLDEDDTPLRNNFMRKVKQPQGDVPEKVVLSPDDFNKLLEEARLGRNPIRDEAMLLLMLDTGIRREELRTLTVNQVDTVNDCINSVLGKGGKRRPMVFSIVTSRALDRYLKQRPTTGDNAFFLTDSGKQFTDNGLYEIFRRLRSRTGVHVHPHAFRHTFATSMLNAGASTLTVQNMLGHSKPDVTNMYYHMTQASAREAHERYSPVLALHKSRTR